MIIEVKDLIKRYGELRALDHFSLNVAKGEIFGLLGPNGSGKTTAINCMLALLKYDSGEIRLFGEEMAPTRLDLKRRIGVVPQNVAVFSEMNVYENIDYFCSLYIREKSARKALVEEAIEFTGLGDYRKFAPRKLSGGLLRRLNIACGVAHKPELIFFDEPTVAVDPQSRNHILEGIQRLNREGATVIYTSHYMEEVEQICSRIMIMDKGKAVATGTTDELKAMISTGEKLTIEAAAIPESVLASLGRQSGVTRIDYNDSILNVHYSGASRVVSILDHLYQNNVPCARVATESPTLNDVFLEITGKRLRD